MSNFFVQAKCPECGSSDTHVKICKILNDNKIGESIIQICENDYHSKDALLKIVPMTELEKLHRSVYETEMESFDLINKKHTAEVEKQLDLAKGRIAYLEFRRKERITEQNEITEAAIEWLKYIIEKHKIKSIYDMECPYARRLAFAIKNKAPVF